MRGDVEDTRKRIAYLIRAELVCCDIYDQIAKEADERRGDEDFMFAKIVREFRARGEYHAICYYGEWSALLAESGDLPEHVYYGPSDEHPDSPIPVTRPRRTPDPRND